MSSTTHDFAPQVPRFNAAEPSVEVDRRDHSQAAVPVPAASPEPVVDRTLRQPADSRITVLPARTVAAPVSREAPRNHAELNAFIAERQRESLSQPTPTLSLAAQSGSAVAVLDAHQDPAHALAEMAPAEVEARTKLRDALNVRAGAREALVAKEAALAKAKVVQDEAIVAETKASLAEAHGGDELTRKLVAWAEKGGEKPDLAPDPASLDARHARDRARVHATAARQAVAAISEVVEAKRQALAEAETKVQAAARAVVEATAETIATEGRKAGEVHRRAQLAAHALQRMQNGLAAQPLYRLKPDTAELAKTFTGPRPNEPADALSGATATWQAFQRTLETDADAALS